MTDNLLGAILGHPRSVHILGQLLCFAAAALALLGLRIDRLTDHMLQTTGTAAPAIEWVAPGWLAWAIPETLLGWFAVASLFATGFCIAKGARAIQRLTHEGR